MTERAWVNTGTVHKSPEGGVDRIPPYDERSGEHLWMVIPMYRVRPELWTDDSHLPVLDHENLLSIQGPGCFYCERPYTPSLRMRRCKGKP